MLSCRELVDEITANPELAESDRKLRWSIRLHLLMCGHCRRYTRQLQHLLHILPGVHRQQPPVDPDAVDRIYKNIETHQDKDDLD